MTEHIPLGDVEDGLELKLTLNREVLHCKMVLPVVGQALVERAILISRDIAGVASPDWLGLVEDVVLSRRLLDLFGLLLLLLVLVFDLLNLWLIAILLFLRLLFVILNLLPSSVRTSFRESESRTYLLNFLGDG
jgi:hypothetical protein